MDLKPKTRRVMKTIFIIGCIYLFLVPMATGALSADVQHVLMELRDVIKYIVIIIFLLVFSSFIMLITSK